MELSASTWRELTNIPRQNTGLASTPNLAYNDMATAEEFKCIPFRFTGALTGQIILVFWVFGFPAPEEHCSPACVSGAPL